MATKRFCKLHKKPSDSFCLPHQKLCCSDCHGLQYKNSKVCQVVDYSEATRQLKEEGAKSFALLKALLTDAGSTKAQIDERITEVNGKKQSIQRDVTEYFKALRAVLDHQEKATLKCLKETASDFVENLSETNARIDHLIESVDGLGKPDFQSDPNLLDIAHYNEEAGGLVAVGEDVLHNVPEQLSEEWILEFNGGDSDLTKIKELVANSCKFEIGKHEGTVFSAGPPCPQSGEEGAPNGTENEDRSRLSVGDQDGYSSDPLSQRGSKSWKVVKTMNISGKIEVVKFLEHSKNSDLIMVTREPAFIKVVGKDGHEKLSLDVKDLGFIADVCVKDGIVHVPSYASKKIHIYDLSSFSLISTVKANGNCRSVDTINNNYVVAYSNPPAVRLVDTNGYFLAESKYKFTEGLFVSVQVGQSAIMVVQQLGSSIVVLFPDLTTAWKVTNCELKCPRGLSLCLEGAYVPCRGNESILLVNQKGEYQKTMLKNVSKLWCAAYNASSRKFAVIVGQDYRCVVYGE